MINVNQITAQLARMPDQALQRYAQMNKSDPYILSLALSESNRRKEMRAGAQMSAPAQPKVVDQELAGMASVDPMGNYTGMPLPENVGIGRLPAKNLARMAMGGIVAFDDGGEVPRFNKGGSNSGDSLFDEVFKRTLRYEGVYGVDTGGPTKYGISKRGNPDVDIENLTPEKAKQIYKERYWDAISGDKLAKINPALAQVAFDTAVNQGIGRAKEFITKSGGDPVKMMELRSAHYDSLVQNDPDTYGKYAKGWKNRLSDLATSVFPAATAGELASGKAAPTTANVSAPSPSAPWYDRGRELFMSGEAQKAMLHGLQDVPAALLGAPADIGAAVLRPFGYKQQPTLGSKWWEQKFEKMGMRVPDSANPDLQTIRAGTTGVASLINPFGRAETVETGLAAAARRQAQTAAEAEAAIKNPRLAGPTTDATMVQKPGKAPVIQGQAVARQADDIARAEMEAAKAAELSKAAAAQKISPFQTRVNPVGALATAANAPSIVGYGADATGAKPVNMGEAADYSAFGQETDPMTKLKGQTSEGIEQLAPTPTAQETTGQGKGGLESLFSNPLFLMGARLMAGTSPFAMQNIGQAGIGTAADLAAQRKAEREEDYYSALAQRARSLAKTEGLTGNTQLAYYLGSGDTTEQRVKSGLPILTAMNNQMKALELGAEQQKIYWDYAIKAAREGAVPEDPKTWAMKSRSLAAFMNPRGVNTIAEGQSVYGR